MQKLSSVLLSAFALLTASAGLRAQTATTGVISGTVSDTSSAVVPGASLELEQAGTGVRQAQTTNEAGQYVFSNVAPGLYKITVTKTGFRTAALTQIQVEVAKSYIQEFHLELGAVAERIDVIAQGKIELQTADATAAMSFPANRRCCCRPPAGQNERCSLAAGRDVTGEVTEAQRPEHLSVDGITHQPVGGSGTYVPGLESVEEFRVG
jgi:hypothetical protein